MFDTFSECPVNLKLNCIHVNGKQDKSDENRSKCPVDGSMFPHPWIDEVIKCPCEYYIHTSVDSVHHVYVLRYMYFKR